MPESVVSFREQCAVLRDLAIIAAVVIYFVGFVYLYYFFASFGISLIAIAAQIPPFAVFAFAYNALVRNLFVTIGFIFVVVVLTWLYTVFQELLSQRDSSLESDDKSGALVHRRRRSIGKMMALPFMRDVVHEMPRGLLILSGASIVLVIFPLCFAWAHRVAQDDAGIVFRRVHEGSPRHLRLIVMLKGPLVDVSREFAAVIQDVNEAGTQGHAHLVGETADRVFVLVGIIPREKDEPSRWLHGDRVFAVSKAQIAVEEGE